MCGNTNVGKFIWDTASDINPTGVALLGWDRAMHSQIDVRLYYSYRSNAKNDNGQLQAGSDTPFRGPEAYTNCRWSPSNDALPWFYRFSNESGGWPICYSTEALKYAQTGYLISIVCVQWADLMICKTRNLSLAQQGMVNCFGNFGLCFETILVAILCYVPFLNMALTTR